MNSNPSWLDRLADAAADGTPVDWDHALRRADSVPVRELVKHLREIARITVGHREVSATEKIAAAARSAPRSESGMTIDKYSDLSPIDEDVVSVTYAARGPLPEQTRVALRLIRWEVDGRAVLSSFRARLRDQRHFAQTAIALPGDAGLTHEGRVFFVSRLVEGVSITEHCRRADLATSERTSLFIEVCEAMQKVHEAGLVHACLSAAKVVMSMQSGRPVPTILDLGSAAALSERTLEWTIAARRRRITPSLAYTSPEELTRPSSDLDARSDVYSLGVLLYELLTNSLPFETPDSDPDPVRSLRRAILGADPIGLHQAGLPVRSSRPDVPGLAEIQIADAVAPVLRRALDKDPQSRPGDAGSFARALHACLPS